MTAAVLAVHWHLAIGGSDALSWCVVVVYLLAAALASWAAVVARRAFRRLSTLDPGESRAQQVLGRVWVVVAVVLAGLAINKQFDLSTELLKLIRRISYDHGWYGRRRKYQELVIEGLVAGGLVLGAAVAFVLRRVLGRIALVIVALTALVVYVAVRSISLHYVDTFLESGGRYASGGLEAAGIALVVIATLLWLLTERSIVATALERSGRRPPPPPPSQRPANVAATTAP